MALTSHSLQFLNVIVIKMCRPFFQHSYKSLLYGNNYSTNLDEILSIPVDFSGSISFSPMFTFSQKIMFYDIYFYYIILLLSCYCTETIREIESESSFYDA